ncbi:Hypothetical protein CINCED_3A006773 [Cinara cedri]|nr:Hypothetical protein CINCED_3A006773 [Cinara cedri]
MCLSFWQLVISDEQNQCALKTLNFESVMNENLNFTVTQLFNEIKLMTKKFDAKPLSSILWEFCKVVCSLASNQNILNLFVSNLEKNLKHTCYLETEPGKMTIADIFTSSEHLFLRFHNIVMENLPKANKCIAKAYGEIYFIAWINSTPSMREIIEQQGMFDIIYRSFTLQRKGPSFQTYHNILIFMQSMQKHRKHLMFSKAVTKLYTPVLWRQLGSDLSVVRCNAIEILARAYPLEKRGEGREVGSRFLTKQQEKFIDFLEDPCPQVRISAIKGLCSCMRYFWESFEDNQIKHCFRLFAYLIEDSICEVRLVVIHGFRQLLEENKSHNYFKKPLLVSKIKTALTDENEKVRRAVILFLLKVKKVDCSPNGNTNTINFATIVNLTDVANALADEDRQNGVLLVDLIFDNFIGPKVPNRHATLIRLIMFYKMNPVALRNLLFYSESHLKFNDGCDLMLSLLKTVYNLVKKKQQLKLQNKTDNETNNDSDGSQSDSSSSSSSISDDIEQNEHINVCCILDSVNVLMILYRDTFIEKNNRKQFKEIQDSCVHCLIKILKFYKEGDAYYSAMSLASVIPVSKLTPHISVSSIAISSLKKLPYDLKYLEEDVDLRKVDCLVYTLCMWNRGYEIIQFVNVWFDEAFKTLNLNDSRFPDAKEVTTEGKRVRFQANIDECKPMTGIILINAMLTNSRTQKSLLNSEINRKNIYDQIIYLQRVKPAIESRISSDNELSTLVSDEVLLELFRLNLRLHLLYHIHESNYNVDEIINYQVSIMKWIINNILSLDLRPIKATTVIFVVRTIENVNTIVYNTLLMQLMNKTFLNTYSVFCAKFLGSMFGPRVTLSTVGTLIEVAKNINLKSSNDNNIQEEIPLFINCVGKIILGLGESKISEEYFKIIFGTPIILRRALIQLLLEVYKISKIEFKKVFSIMIDTIMDMVADEIRNNEEVDLNENLIDMPFAASQLTAVILNNVQLRRYFSLNAVNIFSSDMYKNDCLMLLSAISLIHTLSFQLTRTIEIDLEPVVKLLYKSLMELDEKRTLEKNLTVPKKNNSGEPSILEVSDFNYEITNFKQKGRNVLIATAKQLHITLCD